MSRTKYDFYKDWNTMKEHDPRNLKEEMDTLDPVLVDYIKRQGVVEMEVANHPQPCGCSGCVTDEDMDRMEGKNE